MKKYWFVMISIFAFHGLVNAQFLQFGVRAGVGSSSLIADNVDIQGVQIEQGRGSFGIHGGLFSRVNIGRFHVQPELLLSSVGGEYEVRSGGVQKNGEVRFTRLDIPVLAGWRFGEKKAFRLNLGPVASVKLSEDNGFRDALVGLIDGAEQDYKNNTTWGFQAGMGVDIAKKVALDLKYEGNLSAMGDEIKVFGQQRQLDTRSRQIMLSVGYWF